MKAPKRLFQKKQHDHDVIITSGREKNIILSDPDLADLQGYIGEIRNCWWRAYREGIENPVVVAAHKRSQLAVERGQAGAEDFIFFAISSREAHESGWPVDFTEVNQPPTMGILLATGDRVECHVTSDMTPTGLIDLAHFNEEARSRILRDLPEADRSELSSLFDQPWLQG
jgi:hypothetical protein